MIVPGGHHCFPDAAFLLLPVAHETVNPIWESFKAAGQRVAGGDAEALAEGATGDFDAGQLERVRMAFEPGAELAQQYRVIKREVACLPERDIKRRRLMTRGPEDPISPRPLGIVRVMVEDAQVECGSNVHDGQGASGMAGTDRK